MPGKPKLCQACKKVRASCGIPGNKPSHCGKCKSDDMTNVTVTKCEVCTKVIANYGFPGKKPTHCKSCKIDNMTNIRSTKCKKCKEKQPSYGIKGTKNAEYCIDCKLDDMVDVRSPKCIICNIKQPCYADNSRKKATHCASCKIDTMIDIKSKMCTVCNIKNPIYGLPGGTNTHCKDCKTEDLIDVKNRKCIICKNKQATYGDSSTNILSHCKLCKPNNYIDLKHALCKNSHCITRAGEKYRGYCAWCFQHIFPDDPIAHEIKKKTYEMTVVTEVLAYDSSYKHDTALFIGGCDCSIRRRIDLWKMINNTILAIEIDEYQHSNYDKEDERIRYDDLFMGFSGKWIFIRFNPNNFRDSNGKIKKVPMKNRLNMLLNTIKYQEKRIENEENNELIEIHKLFFNGFKPS